MSVGSARLRGWRLDLRRNVQREGTTAAAAAVCGGVVTCLGGLTVSSGSLVLTGALFALGGLLFCLAIGRAVHWARLSVMERNS